MADGRGQGVYMLHRKTRSRSWKGVAVLGALASLREVCLPSADAFPTVLRYSICTPCPLTLSLPLSAFGGGGAGERFPQRAMVPKAPSKSLWGGGRSMWVYVIFRPLEVRWHLVNAPHEVRQ